MCEHSEKLMAWLDHELQNDEMAQLQQHIQACAECHSQLDAFQQASNAFTVYRDSVLASNSPRRLPRWVPTLSLATALATAAALFLFFHHTTVERLVAPSSSAQAAPHAALLEKAPVPAPNNKIHRRRASPPATAQAPNLSPTEPAIQISLPVESMFPPGAVPEGISFTADVSIAADGSAQQIQLRPQMIGFERRTVQP
ncbi:MAG: zf-HC2 domain-containing protein [Candidatus Acidiferrum sp.]